jgi:nucleotide-binding universal stress UspA family protein
LAQATGGHVTALHVGGKSAPAMPGRSRVAAGHEEAEAILNEIVRLGAPYGVTVETKTSTRASIADAILVQLERDDIDVLVLGVNPRPGEHLAFGSLAATLVKRTPCSLLFVSPEPFNPAADARAGEPRQSAA